jgi:DNA-binding NtrC family response regulator
MQLQDVAVAIQIASPGIRRDIEVWLAAAGFRTTSAWRPEIVLALTDSLDTARKIRNDHPSVAVLFIPQVSSEALAIQALRCGCADYVSPCTRDRALEAVARFVPASRETARLIGKSAAIDQLRIDIQKIARAPSNVLITGETGTGKELVAQLIHSESPRRARQMVAINCAALPDTLLESELFGFERGAFTGAVIARDGKLRQAEGGTVFLDEIGEMSPLAQAKILRAIETRQVERLGGSRSTPVDFRVIAATNRDLRGLIEERRFREDLFFRLNVATIELPPLRARKEDIPALVMELIAEMNPKFNRQITKIESDALDALLDHDWPGNIRELRNVVEAAFIHLPFSTTEELRLPPSFRGSRPSTEEDRLRHALDVTHWNKSEAARHLQWSRMTLYRKLAKYHLMSSSPAAKRSAQSVTSGAPNVTAANS